ncbi:MAG: hypothetical protein F6K00_32150 [Leptolyngbya sp. SIOISBB]|nr:hypothetical protein [Leptolyngbya sp. SIOISBB]
MQGYTRRLDALEHRLTEETPRLSITPQDLAADIVAHLQFLQGQVATVKKRLREHLQPDESLQQQQELLISIVGVGKARRHGCWQKLARLNTLTRLVNWPPLPD